MKERTRPLALVLCAALVLSLWAQPGFAAGEGEAPTQDAAPAREEVFRDSGPVAREPEAPVQAQAPRMAARLRGGEVSYLACDENGQNWTTETCTDFTEVTAGDTDWADGWYYAGGSVTLSDRVVVTGNVRLILGDGFTLTASKGIQVSEGNSLTIYGQSEGDGKGRVIANSYTGMGNAAIGGNKNGKSGAITISGGIVTATSEGNGAGIGGGDGGAGGTITISGGTVTATGGYGAGIGGGGSGAGGTIEISGGMVKATADAGAGIGSGGGTNGKDGKITITGGEIEAISNGMGAGIGSGQNGNGFKDSNFEIIIENGKVTATGSRGAGIGGGFDRNNGTVTISGGEVTATSKNGAGIGSGISGAGGTIEISGGTVTATSQGDNTGGNSGAGIGGGQSGAGGTIIISGGTVTATSGGDGTAYFGRGAGIGGGENGAGGTIEISGGTVTATSKGDGAGIGGGYNADGGTITISSGTVNATANFGAGIGGGQSGTGGTITISGGTVTATSTTAAGIGSDDSGATGAFTTTPDGAAWIDASSISDQSGKGDWHGVIIERNTGKVYGGTVSLTGDAANPAGKTLAIPENKTLVIPEGVTLTNDGAIQNDGALIVYGALAGTGTIAPRGASYPVTVTAQAGGTAAAAPALGAEGTTVTLTATPGQGYHFKEWQVEPDTVTIGADNTFTMPSQRVTVRAVFEADVPDPPVPPVTPDDRPSSGGSGGSSEPSPGFWRDTAETVASTPSGGRVELDLRGQDSLPREVVEALGKNPGVSLVIRWSGGTITIPAGKAPVPEPGRIYYPLSYLASIDFGAAGTNPETGGPAPGDLPEKAAPALLPAPSKPEPREPQAPPAGPAAPAAAPEAQALSPAEPAPKGVLPAVGILAAGLAALVLLARRRKD